MWLGSGRVTGCGGCCKPTLTVSSIFSRGSLDHCQLCAARQIPLRPAAQHRSSCTVGRSSSLLCNPGCLLAPRLSQRSSVLVRSAPPEHSSQNHPNPQDMAAKLLKALSYEQAQRFCNAPGRASCFNRFAQTQLASLQLALPNVFQQQACCKLNSEFAKYPAMPEQDRRQLVLQTARAVMAWEPSLMNPQVIAQKQQQAQWGRVRQAKSGSQVSGPLSLAATQPQQPAAFSQRLEEPAQAQSPPGHSSRAAAGLRPGVAEVQPARRPPDAAASLAPAGLQQAPHMASSALAIGIIGSEEAARSTGSSLAAIQQLPSGSLLNESLDQDSSPETPLAPTDPSTTDASSSLEPDATRRGTKAETLAFRTSFISSAAAASSAAQLSLAQPEEAGTPGASLGDGEQRTAEWHALREGRLTASAFGNALGFWDGGRSALWEEKLKLRPRFAGNAATMWGTSSEDLALQRYQQITGHQAQACRFHVLRDDLVHGWLGASPDGLVDALGAQPGDLSASDLVVGQGAGILAGEGPGVLEIKCPFNRGNPQDAAPPKLPQWYYMPQVQGLMEVFDREWCNMYIWTQNGSGLFHVKRDRSYWDACFDVLAQFWWQHVVPAKHALQAGDMESALSYRPHEEHPLTKTVMALSKDMAFCAAATMYPPDFAGRQTRVQLAPKPQLVAPLTAKK